MHLRELWDLAVKTAASTWPFVGPLIGVLIGAYLSNRNQKKQRVADNKKQEYRELMSAFSEAFNAVLDGAVPMHPYGPEEQQAFARAKTELVTTIGDRLFIVQELENMKALDRWMRAVSNFHSAGNEEVFTQAFVGITADIVKAASRLSD
jgi:hypothetical protein